MPSDMYSDAPEEAPDAKETHSGDDGGETAVLPKSILAGKKFNPGDEIVLKIDAIYDDSVAVSYSHGDDGDKKEGMENEGAETPSAQSGGMSSSMYE